MLPQLRLRVFGGRDAEVEMLFAGCRKPRLIGSLA
jgi:hypothetical protein